ncbi:elongation factor G [Hoyosella sp. YIM 151337]|uniref:elongation factor G n=1 Tax=Hoyosella sp. YIM 151337 TaxID=2992742 RepID=UPI0035A9446C
MGHHGNGKTSLAEALLAAAGAIGRAGRVENGNTTLDTQPEERSRAQTLTLGLASFTWNDYRINLIDTPGYLDFAGDAEIALQVADMAVFVVDGVSGLQVSDEMMWAAAAERGLPRLVFINKMDKDRASFATTLEDVRAHFGQGIEPIELPVGEARAFTGVTDLLSEHTFFYDTGSTVERDEVPPEIAAQEHEEHEHLLEDVIQIEDDLLARYLDGETITVTELGRALRSGFATATLWPVLCGSATEMVAVDRLLDFICRLGPGPDDLPGPRVGESGKTVTLSCRDDGPTVGYVFKTQTDEYVGQVAYLKLLSGTIHADEVLINQRTGAKERLHNLLTVLGNKTTSIGVAEAGDIIAAIKLSDVATGDTLAPPGSALTVAAAATHQPVYAIAVSPQRTGDEDKLATALAEMVRDDPTLHVERDPDTHQLVIRGAGDVHVQVALSRVQRRFGVSVGTEPVKVAYRETLAKAVQTEGRHKKQSGGHGQFGVATVRFEPLPRDSGFEFHDETKGGVIPKSLVPAVGKGISESMGRGGREGHPLVDIRATVTDGKHHSVDSDEFSFRMAGALALKEAIERVGTIVLEPIVHVEVTVPDAVQGDVLADLARRRGQIEGTEPATDGHTTIIASVPQGEVLDYAVSLRSMTHGRGRFTAEFARYQQRP